MEPLLSHPSASSQARSASHVEASSAPQARPEALVAAAQFNVARRLMDSMLHDARNPLNALAINLDVLAEKLKKEGQVPASQEKNLKAMRDQIFRIDGILKDFSEAMTPHSTGAVTVDFSDTVTKALELLSYESRRNQVKFKVEIQPGLKVRVDEGAAARFIAMQTLLRALSRSKAGMEIGVSLRSEGGRSWLRVHDQGEANDEPFAEALPALDLVCAKSQAELGVREGDCWVSLP